MIGLVPISNENGVITSGIWEGDRNSGPAKDPDASKTTSSLVELKRREVVKAPNLILHLEHVCEVLPRGYWACCSIYTIHKRVPPILNSIPIFSTNKKENYNYNQANYNFFCKSLTTIFSDECGNTKKLCIFLRELKVKFLHMSKFNERFFMCRIMNGTGSYPIMLMKSVIALGFGLK